MMMICPMQMPLWKVGMSNLPAFAISSLSQQNLSCVDMSSLWVFIRLPYESPRVGTCVMSLVPLQKASNIVYIRLLSKHFCPQPFSPKDWVFLLFAKSVNLDLQIAGKCIFGTLLTSKHMLSIADKHHFPCEHYGVEIKYTKSHQQLGA